MKYIGVLASLLLLTGCASPVSEMSKEKMAKPIDCADARQDIAVLQKEKASVLKRIGAGASFILPIGVVVNIFQEGRGQGVIVSDKKAVASGEYNKAIAAKIAEIKKTCKI